jgi:hypothetical protein
MAIEQTLSLGVSQTEVTLRAPELPTYGLLPHWRSACARWQVR